MSISDTGRQRQFTDDEKLRIVEESYRGGVTAAEVARRHEITRSMIYDWRRSWGIFWTELTGMAVAAAGYNPYLASFYGRLLNQGRRMLHLHFTYLEQGHGGYLLTDEHDEMLEAIRDRDIARADALAHAHTRQCRDNFIDNMTQNNLRDAPLIPVEPA